MGKKRARRYISGEHTAIGANTKEKELTIWKEGDIRSTAICLRVAGGKIHTYLPTYLPSSMRTSDAGLVVLTLAHGAHKRSTLYVVCAVCCHPKPTLDIYTLLILYRNIVAAGARHRPGTLGKEHLGWSYCGSGLGRLLTTILYCKRSVSLCNKRNINHIKLSSHIYIYIFYSQNS